MAPSMADVTDEARSEGDRQTGRHVLALFPVLPK